MTNNETQLQAETIQFKGYEITSQFEKQWNHWSAAARGCRWIRVSYSDKSRKAAIQNMKLKITNKIKDIPKVVGVSSLSEKEHRGGHSEGSVG